MKNSKNLNFLKIPMLLLLAILIGGCSKKVIYPAPTALSQDYVVGLSVEKQMAIDFVTASKSDSKQLNKIIGEGFISFDQVWKGNNSSFIQKRNLDKSFSQMKPIRVLQDASLVAVHSRMYGDTLRFRWDILRFENNKIIEHWSNVSDSLGLNPDNHSEIDGPTIPQQLDQTDTNRAHIYRFMQEIMIREEGGAAKFFNFGIYIQHNRDVGDGLSGLVWAMYKMKRAGKVIKFKNNFHVIAEGNLVLSATEGYVGDQKTIFYDFFRIEENKIVEHWDIISPIEEFIYFNETEGK